MSPGIGIGPALPFMHLFRRSRDVSGASVNALSYGLKGDNTTEDASKVEAMIEHALSLRNEPDGHGVEIYFPPGWYRIPPVEIERDDFEFYKLRFRGAGKDQTFIRAETDTSNVFKFTSPLGKYAAQLSFHGLQFYRGNTVIEVDNWFYSEIVDCVFRRTGEGGDYSVVINGTSSSNRIINVMVYHAEDFLNVTGGNVLLADSQIGEDAGGIKVGGNLRCVGVRWDESTYSRANTPDGYDPACIIVNESGRVQVVGCSATIAAGHALVSAHYSSTVRLECNEYALNGGSIVWSGFLADDRGDAARGIHILGGSARLEDDSALWTASDGVANCSVIGLQIDNSAEHTCTVPDDFFNPNLRNTYRDNHVTYGVT